MLYSWAQEADYLRRTASPQWILFIHEGHHTLNLCIVFIVYHLML